MQRCVAPEVVDINYISNRARLFARRNCKRRRRRRWRARGSQVSHVEDDYQAGDSSAGKGQVPGNKSCTFGVTKSSRVTRNARNFPTSVQRDILSFPFLPFRPGRSRQRRNFCSNPCGTFSSVPHHFLYLFSRPATPRNPTTTLGD